MATYIALLRGINVGGNPLKMERLRELCCDLGFARVRTYIQSGNVIFDAKGPVGALTKTMEGKLQGETRLPVPVVIRSAADMAGVISGNAFLKNKAIDRSRLYVTFLGGRASKEALAKLSESDFGEDQFRCTGRELYLYLPNGVARSKLAVAPFERLFGVPATTRNWNTVTRLHAMAAE